MKDITSEFLEGLLRNYDPDIDLSSGGPAWTEVIQPILDRLDLDPVETDFSTFALTLLQDRYSDLDFNEGDALAEAVAKPMQLLVRPLLDQLAITLRMQSLDNWQQMSDDELDSRLSNFFHSRAAGDYASGPVRLYYRNPTTENVGSGVVFISKSGLEYYPSLPQSIASDVMAGNKEGGLYYFDVYVTAAEAGDEYNVDANEITTVRGLTRPVSVKNLRKLRNGLPRETNTEAVVSAKSAITEESLTSVPGIFTKLRRNISGITHIRVVGFGDDEMARDVIRGGGAGVIREWGVDARTYNDGDGDASTQILEMPLADFTVSIGPVGAVSDSWLVTFAGADYTIIEVLSATRIKVSEEIPLLGSRPNLVAAADISTVIGSAILTSVGTDFSTTAVLGGGAIQITAGADVGWYKILEVGYGGDGHKLRVSAEMTASAAGISYVIPFGYPWYLREKVLTLSEIPGGFVTDNDELPDNEVHIGGMTDVYLSGETIEDSLTLLAAPDQEPLVRGEDLLYVAPSIVASVTTDFEEAGVVPGYSLVIEEGADAGVYNIYSVSGLNLYIDGTLAVPFAGYRYYVTDIVDVELTDPQELKIDGDDMRVVIGQQIAFTDPLINFTDAGVVVGDYLEILGGPDAGEYEVTEITNVGDTTLVTTHTFSASQVGLNYRVYRKGAAVDLPVVSVDTLEVLDANSEPTGVYLPYGLPILSEAATAFENVGDGIAVELSDVQLGIIGTVDITAVAAAGTDLKFYVDDVAVTVTFSVAAVTAEVVVDEINAVEPDVAAIYMVGTEKRLALQSVTRLIVTDPTGTANGILGISVAAAEYNDQLIPSGVVTDLSTYGLTTRSVVMVDSGTQQYYKLHYIGATYSRAYSVLSSEVFWLSGITDVSCGHPSTGVVRMRFKDPTFLQLQGPREAVGSFYPWKDYSSSGVQQVSSFTASVDGASLNFYADLDMESVLCPPGDDDYPNNGTIGSGPTDDTFGSVTAGMLDGRSERISFPVWETAVLDVLGIKTFALVGDIDLAGVLALTNKYLKIRIDDFLFTVTFDANDVSVSDVTDAINHQTGETIASVHSSGAFRYLILESDKVLSLESDGGADDATDLLLRTVWEYVTTTNVPAIAGDYKISDIAPGGDVYAVKLKTTTWATMYFTRETTRVAVNAAVAAYVLHYDDGDGDNHAVDDATNAITLGYPLPSTCSDADVFNLWNELVLRYNLHDANNLGLYHTGGSAHQAAGLGIAASLADVITEFPLFRAFYMAHLEDGAGYHDGVDTPDTDHHIAGDVDTMDNIHFTVSRRGCQRISPPEMESADGFYYADVEVVSEGIGDLWNIAEGTELTPVGYRSYGWWLTTGNEALSYSPSEELWLHMTPAFLPGTSYWEPDALYWSCSQNYAVAYTKSQIVDEANEYLTSMYVRNVLHNALAKHLLPAYVYAELSYSGGSQTSILEDDIEQLIKAVRPDDSLTVYDIARALSKRGAETMENPVTLFALSWEVDRALKLTRSTNELDLGIRYVLYPGVLTLRRG